MNMQTESKWVNANQKEEAICGFITLFP